MGRRLDIFIGNLEAGAVRLQERIAVNMNNVQPVTGKQLTTHGVGYAIAMLVMFSIWGEQGPPVWVAGAVVTVTTWALQVITRKFL